MKINKTFQLNIPISKVDEEQRIVTGIATSETLDSQGDIVDYEASKKAFSEWPGNIREMHSPVAIGKGIDVEFNDETKEVIVSAKISESADGENAWIKVKEKVLTGFSIGGRVFEVAKDKAIEGANRVLDYSLSELSLVDNPANPDAELIMVKSMDGGLQRVEQPQTADAELPMAWWATKFMSPDLKKAGVAVVDGDARDASGASVAEVTPTTPKKAGTIVPKKVYGANGGTVNKSVYDAQEALSLASQLTWLIISEEPDQRDDLITAFNALRDFASKEVAEGDDFDWTGEYTEVVELANNAINLRKDKAMAKKDDKEIVEKTNVIAGEERDHEAEVVETAEEAGRPLDDTTERAAEVAEAEEKVETDEEADKAEAEDEAEEAEVVEDAKDDGKKEEKKSDDATDLLKNVETLLTKLADNKEGAELKKVTDQIKSDIGKVAKSMTALEDRVKAIEDQPVPTKGSRYQVVAKGEDDSEVEGDVKELLKRQDELVANPHDAKPGEMAELAMKLRKANIGEPLTVN